MLATTQQGSGAASQTGGPLMTAFDVSFRYGQGRESVLALGNITFEVSQGEFVSIVGPSGCGKTTLLRSLSGLAPVTSGRLTLGGRVIDGVPADLALCFRITDARSFPG